MKKKIIIPTLIALGFTSCTLSDYNVNTSNEQETYLVSFNTDGGSFIKTQKITEGNIPMRPSNPIKKGYGFSGWYLDEAKTVEYNFDTKITSDVILYAKWEDNFYNFDFISPLHTCTINDKFVFNDEIPVGEKDVKYTLVARDGYNLPYRSKITLPDGILYNLKEGCRTAELTIKSMDDNYSISIEANVANNVTLTLNDGDNFNIDGKDENITLSTKPGVIERVFHIKPDEGFSIPTLDMLNIEYKGDPSDYEYDDKSGTLTIHKIYNDFTASPSVSSYVNLIAYTNYSKFRINSSSVHEDYMSSFNGKIDENDLTWTDKNLIFYYHLTDPSIYTLNQKEVLIYLDGQKLNDGYFTDSGGGNYFITIKNAIQYKNIFVDIEATFKDDFRLVNFNVDNESHYVSYKISVNDEPIDSPKATVKAPKDKETDYYVKVHIDVDDKSYFKINYRNLYFKSSPATIDSTIKDDDGNGTSITAFVNLNSIDDFTLVFDDTIRYPFTLNELDFGRINDIACYYDNPDDYFNIGDTKKITLKEEDLTTEQTIQHTVRIIGFNHDELPDSTQEEPKKAKITFEFADLLSNDIDTANKIEPFTIKWKSWHVEKYETGWDVYEYYENGNVDDYLKGTFIDRLPENIKNNLVTVKKSAFKVNGTKNYYINRSTFALSYKELCGIDFDECDKDTKSSIYEFYEKDNTNKRRVKKYVNGTEGSYYTRICDGGAYDISFSNSEDYGDLGIVNNSGKMSCSEPTSGSTYKAVAPAFCIGI